MALVPDRSRRALAADPGRRDVRALLPRRGSRRCGRALDTLAELRRARGVSLVAFGALPTVAAGVVPRALQRFATSPLACRCLVESGPSPYLLELLRTAAIDFVVGRLARPEA